jgi:hypothetical protein
MLYEGAVRDPAALEAGCQWQCKVAFMREQGLMGCAAGVGYAVGMQR